MSTMVIEFYEALLEAGASKEKATKAAQVASTFVREGDSSLLGLATDMGEVRTDMTAVKMEIEVVKAQLTMIQWLMGGLGFGIILLIIESFIRLV